MGHHFSKGAQKLSMKPITRVTAAILERDGRILIAQRKGGDFLCGKWEFPGGKVEAGETPQTCLGRELKEELAIDVTVGEYLGSHIYHYDHLSIELMAYRAFWVSGVLTMNDHNACRWVPIDQLAGFDFAPADRPFVAMLAKGRIDLKRQPREK